MSNNLKVAIIGAMDSEISQLRELLNNPQSIETKDFSILTGSICNHSIILAKSGIGKVNAAMHTQYIIDKFEPDIIINTGVAGGLGKDLYIGDIVIGTSLVQHDFDLTPLGYAKGYMCIGVAPDKPTIFYSDQKLIEQLENVLAGTKYYKGTIASGDVFVSDANMKKELNEDFDAIAAEMEGAAIAQVAALNNIPFVVVRTISDNANGDPSEFREFEKQMAEVSASTIHKLLKNI